MSQPRMNRYLLACSGNTKKAMTLYRYNLQLSQQLFTIISCFEVALRNAIDAHYTQANGAHWLRNAANRGGMFDTHKTIKTAKLIRNANTKLGPTYTHPKLIAEMDFGFWRYLFSGPQFNAGGKTLLRIFPAKPVSTPSVQYNQKYVFNQLEKINRIRNRIAHHETICFQNGNHAIDTTYTREHYDLIVTLFNWMHINERELLYGIDRVNATLLKIDNL